MFEADLDDEQRAIREVARDLGASVLAPAAGTAESAGGVPAAEWATLLDSGLVSPVDPGFGGGGVPGTLSQALAVEELAAGDAAIAAAAIWSGNAAILIHECGTPSQRGALLPPFVTDPSLRAAVAMYEGFGRAPSEYETTIRPDGDGWRVSGRKIAVPLGAVADPLVIVGTDPTAGGRLRAALPTRDQLSGSVVKTAVHLGLDAAPLAGMTFDLTIGDTQVLAAADAGTLAATISRFRITTAALAIGCAQRARSYACDYVTKRVAFGHPLAGFQGVSFLMADAQMQIEAARLQVWDVAARLDSDEAPLLERETSLAVNYATSIAAQVTRDCVQVLGGHGFLADHPVERWYRATAGLASLDFDPSCSAFAPAL